MRIARHGTAAVALALVAALVPAAAEAKPRCTPKPGKPCGSRLWYRIAATGSGTFTQESKLVPGSGPKYDLHNSWRIESNTAVLLIRQCTIRTSEMALSPKNLGIALGLGYNESCAALRPKLKGPLRKFRKLLADDIRFTANARATVNDFSAEAVVAGDRVPLYNTSPTRVVDCPPSTFGTQRLTRPLDTTGRIQSGSVFRQGVTISIGGARDAAAGSFSRPDYKCVDPVTGRTLRGGAPLDQEQALPVNELFGRPVLLDPSGSIANQFGGALALGPVRLRNVGNKFGVSFNVSGRQTQAGVRNYPVPGSAEKTVDYRLEFRLCPNGGLDVKRC